MNTDSHTRKGPLTGVAGRLTALLLSVAMLSLVACEDSDTFDGKDTTPTPITFELIHQMDVAAQGDNTMPAPGLQKQLAAYDYKLGAGDILDFKFWENPSEDSIGAVAPVIRTNTLRVESDGTVTFPHVGRQKVAGMTLAQLRVVLEHEYKKFFRVPQFDVQMEDFHSKRITVTGAVAKPGIQYLGFEPITIRKAIDLAGGVSSGGDIENATLIHADGTREPIDLLKLLYLGDHSQDRVLYPDDTLVIPDNHRNRVFVMGEVLHAAPQYLSAGHLTLTEALNDAGGLNMVTAAEGRVYVIRNAITREQMAAHDNGFPVEPNVTDHPIDVYQLDTHNPAAFALADQFKLRPRDIIYVGTADITQWNRFISQLIPNAFTYNTQLNQNH